MLEFNKQIYILVNHKMVMLIMEFLNTLTEEQKELANSYLRNKVEFINLLDKPIAYLELTVNNLILDKNKFKNIVTKSNFFQVDASFSCFFDSGLYHQLGLKFAEAKGRGIIDFINLANNKIALKHYYRGGVIAKLSKQKYLWSGLANTRPYKEILIQQKLAKFNFPTPQILAIAVTKHGMFYSGGLISQYLVNAKTLVELLDIDHLGKDEWQEIAKVVALMHNIGINHHDLNANNIIRTNEGWFILDFDKAQDVVELNHYGFREQNIKRLLRSLNKEMANKQILFDLYQWEFFLHAYYDYLDYH